ncbi:MAG TPA: ABC transporter substrate-binding protein, partial [Trueperaceae bacterium]
MPIMTLVNEDSGTSPSVGVDRARKLVNTDQVAAIVGALSSGVTVSVAQSVTIPSGVVLVSPASTSPLLTALQDNDFVFRTTPSDALQGVVAGRLAAGKVRPDYKFATASIIYVNNPYGQGLADTFEKVFEENGGKVLAKVAHPEEPQPTYSAQLSKALAGNPDLLMAISYPGQATVYLPESRDIFGFTSWQFVDGTKSEEIIKAVGAETLAGDLGTAAGADPSQPGPEAFSAAYQQAYGELPPLPYIDTGYDATAVIGLAIAKAIAEGKSPSDVTSEDIRDNLRDVANAPGEVVGVGDFNKALQLLKDGKDINFAGAAGDVNFDDNGDVITPIEIWQYTADGTIETVEIRTPDQILGQ